MSTRRLSMSESGMGPVMVLTSVSVIAWALLLPAMPLAVSAAGGSHLVAGAATGVFMVATVAAELSAPWLLARCDFRAVLATGCLLLGAPCAVLLVSSRAIPVLLAVNAIRGVGFGLLTVAATALLPKLAPRDLLPRAVALQGGINAVGKIAGLALALPLYHAGGLAVGATTAVILTFAGLAVSTRVPGRGRAVPAAGPREPRARESAGVAKLLPICAGVAAAGTAFGGLSAITPLPGSPQASYAGLILMAIATAAIAGRYASRGLAGPLLWRGFFVGVMGCAAGLLLLSAADLSGGKGGIALSLAGAVVFGLGFGAAGNTSIVLAFQAMPVASAGWASASWNVSLDAGIGLGSVAMGASVDVFGYPATHAAGIGVLAVVAAFALGCGKRAATTAAEGSARC